MPLSETLLGSHFAQRGAREMAAQHVKWEVFKIFLMSIAVSLLILISDREFPWWANLTICLVSLVAILTACLQCLGIYGYFNRDNVSQGTTRKKFINPDDRTEYVRDDSEKRRALFLSYGPLSTFPGLVLIAVLLMQLAMFL